MPCLKHYFLYFGLFHFYLSIMFHAPLAFFPLVLRVDYKNTIGRIDSFAFTPSNFSFPENE